VGVIVNRWFNLPIARADQPRLRSYHELLSTRPGYRDHVLGAPPPMT
jgi:hypothetical protein